VTFRRALLAVSLLALAAAPTASARAHRFEYELKILPSPAAAARVHHSHCARAHRGPHRSCASHRAARSHHAARPRRGTLPTRSVRSPVPRVASATATPAKSNASIIASVLAAPCQNTELLPEAANLALVREAVLCLVNHERAQHDELPLNPDRRLQAAAESHVSDMIANDYFEHISPSGVTPVDRVRAAGYLPNESVGYVIGENLAWGTYQLSTPQSIVSAWIASPGHLANILESSYRDTGIAITPQVPSSLSGGSPGATYAQEFGVISE
jgi:uncharacterized protein YkwD